jgi:hypothetical protein
MKILDGLLRAAEQITQAHEEALYCLPDGDPEYFELRAETARRVLHEQDLRTLVGEIARDRGEFVAEVVARTCNHLLYRDGVCVGCGDHTPARERHLAVAR